MARPSKLEQRERVIEVTKTKQEILQKKRKIFLPRFDSSSSEHMKEMNELKRFFAAEEIDAELLFLVML